MKFVMALHVNIIQGAAVDVLQRRYIHARISLCLSIAPKTRGSHNVCVHSCMVIREHDDDDDDDDDDEEMWTAGVRSQAV